MKNNILILSILLVVLGASGPLRSKMVEEVAIVKGGEIWAIACEEAVQVTHYPDPLYITTTCGEGWSVDVWCLGDFIEYEQVGDEFRLYCREWVRPHGKP